MKSKKKKRIVLLDTHAIIHRAYHALPDFTTSAGVPTGALYGLSSMIISIAKDLKPDYIIACYDLPGGTFRSEMDTKYKANRKKIDDGLVEQIIKSREVMEALAIPFYEKKGYEADDLLGTIAEKLKKEKDNEIIIASGDMDTMQLIDKSQVKVFTLKRGLNDTIIYDEKAVIERFGFGPKLLPDYKGLRGDPSDNIVGIAGIGEKTATTLISKFGRIEDIYKKIKKDTKPFQEAGITKRIIDLLLNGEEEAEFSKTLATIILDVPIDFSLPEKTWQESLSINNAEKMFQKFEFRSLLSRFKGVLNIEETKIEEVVKIDPLDMKKFSIALWLLDSEKSNPDIEDVFSYTKTRNLEEARKCLWNELQKNKLDKVYLEIEEPIIGIVKEMEDYGIKIDKKYLENLSHTYHKNLNKIEKEIFTLAGQEFNVKSPKQLSDILFNVLHLSTTGVKKSAGGAYSTQISVLEKLADEHKIIGKIMEYRELQKLLSTYIDVIPDMVAKDGRLHAEFLQNGTTTGRFSSNNPNLQNIPTKTELGKAIRGGFVADKGFAMLSFDYSQMELRLAAIFSGDETLIDIFKNREDVHTSVAAKVFNVRMDEVTKEMRRHAKVINFGILYGMGINALKKNLGSSQKEAVEFYNNYFKQFKSFEAYLEDTKNFARKHGYTETLFGRRRYFPTINSSIPFIQKMAERTAINAPIQGTLADVVKLAMRFVNERLIKEKLKDSVHLILQIHDELIFEVKKDVIDKVIPLIQEEMEGVLEKSFLHFKSDVPITVNFSSGPTWQEL
jgi:DNA polymerase-1